MSITPRPLSWSVALAPGKARPWSVVQMTSVFQGVEHGPDPAVQGAGALLEGGHVQPRLRRVRQVRGRYDVVGLLRGGGPEEFAVGLKEANGEEEGAVSGLLEEVQGDGDDVVGAGGRDLEDLVVADHVRLLAYVLLPDKR
jgi:hypothetical protein